MKRIRKLQKRACRRWLRPDFVWSLKRWNKWDRCSTFLCTRNENWRGWELELQKWTCQLPFEEALAIYFASSVRLMVRSSTGFNFVLFLTVNLNFKFKTNESGFRSGYISPTCVCHMLPFRKAPKGPEQLTDHWLRRIKNWTDGSSNF